MLKRIWTDTNRRQPKPNRTEIACEKNAEHNNRLQRSAGRRSARPGRQAGKTTAVAASVRTELMGVTAAAAAAAVAVAVVAASINLPNLHASLPFPPSLCFSTGAVQKNCIKSLCIFEGIRGGLQHLKFGISTFTACGFPRSQWPERGRSNGGQLLQLINPFALWLSPAENVLMWSVKL